MTHTIDEILPTLTDYLLRSLEAFEHAVAIIEISILLLVLAFVAVVILTGLLRSHTKKRELPARPKRPDQNGRLIRLADWSGGRTEASSCRQTAGGIANGPREDSAAS